MEKKKDPSVSPANKRAGEVEFEAGGQKVILNLGFKRVQAFENSMGGASILDLATMIGVGRLPSVTQCANFLKCLARNPDWDTDKFGEWVLKVGVKSITDPMMVVLNVVTKGKTVYEAEAELARKKAEAAGEDPTAETDGGDGAGNAPGEAGPSA